MFRTLFVGWRSRKPYASAVECNVLVRVVGGGMQRSFFVHQLPADCRISVLRERIAERRTMIPFARWELCLPHRRAAALRDGKRFSHYGIRPWDCVHVRPVAAATTSRADGLTGWSARPVSQRVGALAASLPFRGRHPLGAAAAAAVAGGYGAHPDFAVPASATTIADGGSTQPRPRPYGYLDSSSTSLYSTESLELGAEIKARHLL
ncbi:hypothetical protein IWQ56_002541 [Coemansia nantahalensis]|nr:hypothetical protein IWQ56_002541 [Coemansia nantahalensis]